MKNEITSLNGINEKISELEELEARQIMAVKAHAFEISEALRPSVLVKNAFNEIFVSKNLQRNAIDTSMGIGVGWLVRRLFTINSKNIFRRMTGYALQVITTKLVTKNMPWIREKTHRF